MIKLPIDKHVNLPLILALILERIYNKLSILHELNMINKINKKS